MMPRSVPVLARRCALLLLLLVPAARARAQAPAAAAEAIELAFQLAETGRAMRQALPLMAAAELVLTNPPRALEPSGAPLDVAGWLADADRFAVNAEMRAVVGVLRQRAESGSRGAASGPRAASYQVGARATHEQALVFVPDSPAAIRVRGGAGARLACEVRDDRNRVLARDGGSSSCFLNFTPSERDPVRLVVRNTGAAAAGIVVVTN